MATVMLRDHIKPASGSDMDRSVARSRRPFRIKAAVAAGAAALLAASAYWFAPQANSQTVDRARLTIAAAAPGQFADVLALRGRVEPLMTVYLDAVEGGQVEQVLVEDGAHVKQGQLLAVLSNPDLQLNVLARQTEVTQQINSMRSQELALAQTRLANQRALIEAELAASTARRTFAMQRPLAEQGFVSGRAFADARDAADAANRRLAVLRRQQETDERLQSSQLAQLRGSAVALSSSLGIARSSLDSLNLRAPVAGQLTAFSIQVGQSFARGERLGQVDSAGRVKLRAQVDEFYLGRVTPGQRAEAQIGARTYPLRLAKIYPQVRGGAFEVDLQFEGGEPRDLQRGQTVQLRLALGEPEPALLLPVGPFYADTGGGWVFVVDAAGREAVKRRVQLGRRNADAVEVLDGLAPGERVITSSYAGFAERDRLDLRHE